MTSSRLLDSALSCLGDFPPDENKALQHFESALLIDPHNFLVLGYFGEFLCNSSDGRIRDTERAVSYLKKSIELKENEFPERYFYLAQCLASKSQHALEAEKYYLRGIEELSKELRVGGDTDALQYAKEKIAMAYCAVAELHLTDLCLQNNAEQRIQESFLKAIQVCPKSFDAYSGLACYYGTIQRIDKAIECAEQALHLFKEGLETLRNPLSSSRCCMPQWNSQLQFATTLLNLNKTDWCKLVLDAALEQDERNVEIWRIYALYYIACGEPGKAKKSVDVGQELLTEVIQSGFYKDSAVGQEYVESWTSTLKELNESIIQLDIEKNNRPSLA